jgi:hypothetical protein
MIPYDCARPRLANRQTPAVLVAYVRSQFMLRIARGPAGSSKRTARQLPMASAERVAPEYNVGTSEHLGSVYSQRQGSCKTDDERHAITHRAVSRPASCQEQAKTERAGEPSECHHGPGCRYPACTALLWYRLSR